MIRWMYYIDTVNMVVRNCISLRRVVHQVYALVGCPLPAYIVSADSVVVLRRRPCPASPPFFHLPPPLFTPDLPLRLGPRPLGGRLTICESACCGCRILRNALRSQSPRRWYQRLRRCGASVTGASVAGTSSSCASNPAESTRRFSSEITAPSSSAICQTHEAYIPEILSWNIFVNVSLVNLTPWPAVAL